MLVLLYHSLMWVSIDSAIIVACRSTCRVMSQCSVLIIAALFRVVNILSDMCRYYSVTRPVSSVINCGAKYCQ
jgi:hypothetical protein